MSSAETIHHEDERLEEQTTAMNEGFVYRSSYLVLRLAHI
eukprot:CAMPEP_0198137550 /NCGR_PEP_ID=MMETSP1443-20131203/1015_1 /TAXON_ID=186043 /ORGANISM="Entomoneis sp., Strain CCMP2396" /LENGTH=39 /DNA_ID= /DNA_START= /DNA_END= /DNA_ORIENTATION=